MHNEIVNSNIPNTPARIVLPGSGSEKGTFCRPHIHNEIEILYILDGNFTAYNDDMKITAKTGDIIFINSRVVHATIVETSGTRNCLIQFDMSEVSQNHLKNVSKYLRRFLSSSECPMYIFEANDEKTKELRSYLDEIIAEDKTRKKAYEMYIGANIYKVLALLHRYDIVLDETNFFDSSTIERVLPVLNYIDTHYQEEITLETLSKVINLNQYYFCRLFKRATNSTFTEYLNFVRVCKAEKLLLSGTNTISEISMNVGFSSVSYFNRIFKRYKGCTPSAYKKVKYAVQ